MSTPPPSPIHDLAPIEPAHLLALERLARTSLGADVERCLVPCGELLQIVTELRFLRAFGLARRDAAAALWACRANRTLIERNELLDALDDAIGKLWVIEIAGPP